MNASELGHASRAVLFIDVVDSVRLIEHDEEGTVLRWLRMMDCIENSILPGSGGRVVKHLGDGMLLEFENMQAAASAAFEIQNASARDNAEQPPDSQILLRAGIDVGDVIISHQDLYGRGVNLAARLMGLAGPGEIVVSARARGQLTPHLDADVEDLGECYLKNIEAPVRAFRIGPPGPHPIVQSHWSLGELRPTLAVIPFAVRGEAAEQGILGEVLADEIIRALCRMQELNVISRLSTTAFAGRRLNLDEVRLHLHANYAVSGVCSVTGDSVCLDAELVETKTGQIVWENRLTERIIGILEGDQEIVSHVVAEICNAIMARELLRTRSQPLPTLESYALLMGAITLMHRLRLRDFSDARTMLEAILERGSYQPLAQAWLAKWHVLRVQQGWSDDVMDDAHRALNLTKRALDSDPEFSLALAVDGFVHMNLLRHFDIARERYNLAIHTNPSDALALLLRGMMHAFCDEGEQAVRDTELALMLSPLDLHRFFYDSLAASANLTAGNYARALELANRSLRANRMHTSTWRVLTVAQWQLGMHEEARESARELLRLEPAFTVGGYLDRTPGAAFSIGKLIADVLLKAGVPQ
ncbi:adenylate/guanylate cyclase domain-containing protein [Rhizobium sp. CNPSo 3464]|uniref:adenylate/guanylate cyclase domain-containing protein n=1 Tax=Rhizobium sp. CNPSo 3464 TaxID=3021406 RepID=UPI00254D9806|nr:tetratricopeptide repeat protein [Rhizobium sp. CNPSo 3464]MDK4740073.1 adenylate/guanylate cyclase domain-containing protein [Rhizobium sp. CNPSo 3464]